FEKIVEAVNPARRLGQNPLYNVAFLMQNFPRGDLRGDQFTARFLPVQSQAALLDLRFLAEETAEGLELICEYDVGRLDGATASLLLGAFRQTLQKLIDEPSLPLSQLELGKDFAIPAAAA